MNGASQQQPYQGTAAGKQKPFIIKLAHHQIS